MAKTFMDVQLECVLYPYSQECLELTRECSVIDLMETFIRQAEFLQEAREMELEMGSLITESYFGESEDENELDAVYESVAGKIGNVVKKIWKGICKLFRALGKFIGVCGEQAEKQGSIIQGILTVDPSKLGDHAPSVKSGEYWFYWNRDAYDVMSSIITKYTGNSSDITFDGVKQPGGLNIKYVYDPADKNLKGDVKNIDYAFRAALAFGGASVALKPRLKCATFDQATELASKLKDPKSLSARDTLNSLHDQLQSSFGLSGKNSNSQVNDRNFFTFKVDRGYLSQISKDLTDAATAMEAAVGRIASVSQLANSGNRGNDATREKRGKNVAAFYADDSSNVAGMNGADAKDLHEAYADANVYIGNTLKVFNAYMNFRKAVLKAYGSKTGGKGQPKKEVGTLQDAAPTKEKDISGKEHMVNAGQKVTKTDVEDGSDVTKEVKQAKAQK